MKILSMDIGTKHTAMYKEEIDVTNLTSEEQILTSGKILAWFLVDFTTLPGNIYQNVCQVLNSQQEILLDVDLVLIEQQMDINHKAKEVQHIITTWFTLFAPHAECKIIPSSLKTKKFDMVSETKLQRKFLVALIQDSHLMKTQIALNSNATTIEVIYSETMASLFIPLTPIEEQGEILNFLDAETARLDALAAEASRAIALLKERRSALIAAAVTGQIDVRSLVTEQEAA